MDCPLCKVTALMMDLLVVVSDEQSGDVMLARNNQGCLFTLIET